jgi:hypothetical protein
LVSLLDFNAQNFHPIFLDTLENLHLYFTHPKADFCQLGKNLETFEKNSILVKVKEGENFNQKNISNISRIEI